MAPRWLDVNSLGVTALKNLITRAGLSIDGLVEKDELRARAASALALDRCFPGNVRSGCTRPCCIKPVRCDSADEDEEDEETEQVPASKRPRPAVDTTSSDAFLLPDPSESPEEVLRAKKAAYLAKKKSQRPRKTNSLTNIKQAAFGKREMNAMIHGLSLSSNYDPATDDKRLAHEPWVATEKYDGVRAVWWPIGPDPPGFKHRSGNYAGPPHPALAALLPMDMVLDGELWAGRRQGFQVVMSLEGSKTQDGGRFYDAAWRSLTFVVFDAPKAGGTYLERIEKARARLASVVGDRVRVVVPVPCANAAKKEELLERVTDAGGEGLVLRRAAAQWHCGSKPRDVLKVKEWFDAEAMVIGFGRAPTNHNLPILWCRPLMDTLPPNASSARFELTWSRERPPLPVGTIVTFEYRNIQADGTCFGRRWARTHERDCDCEVCANL